MSARAATLATPALSTRPVRSQRVASLPPYLFTEIDRKRREKIASGADVINLGIGDPDRPTPPFVVETMAQAIRDPKNHKYPADEGMALFREAAARFMHRRFGVVLDSNCHIITCIGSKDGIAHLPLAVVNPGDAVLGGDLIYPVYRSSALIAGGTYHDLPLLKTNGWLPDLAAIPSDLARRAKLLWVNYPANPTAATAPLSFFADAARFCREFGIVLASDHAYSEVYFDEPPPSLWQAPGVDVESFAGIEFHSLSKTFNMTGWRIGFAAGNADVVSALLSIKSNMDSCQFNATQVAAAVALDRSDGPEAKAIRDLYRQRRDVLCAGLCELGIDAPPPKGSFFVWAKCPRGYDSFRFCSRCLDEADVVLIPGGGFGKGGDGYFRAALTVEVDRLREAIERLQRIAW